MATSNLDPQNEPTRRWWISLIASDLSDMLNDWFDKRCVTREASRQARFDGAKNLAIADAESESEQRLREARVGGEYGQITTGFETPVLLSVVTLSTYLTAIGFAPFLKDGYYAAIPVASVVGGCQFLYWYWIRKMWRTYGFYGVLKSWPQALAGVALIISTSTIWMILALGGPEAQRQALIKSVNQVSASIQLISSSASTAESMVGPFRTHANYWKNEFNAEKDTGALSGSRGEGAITRALSAIASKTESLAQALESLRSEEDEAASATRIEAVRQELTDLRRKINRMNITEVEEQFGSLYSEIEGLRNRLAQETQAIELPTILAGIEGLSITEAEVAPLSSNQNLAAKQRGQLEAINERIASTQQELRTALKIAQDLNPQVVVTAYLHPLQAVWENSRLIGPFITFAVFLDIGIGLLVSSMDWSSRISREKFEQSLTDGKSPAWNKLIVFLIAVVLFSGITMALTSPDDWTMVWESLSNRFQSWF